MFGCMQDKAFSPWEQQVPQAKFFICDMDFITYIKTRSEQKFITLINFS